MRNSAKCSRAKYSAKSSCEIVRSVVVGVVKCYDFSLTRVKNTWLLFHFERVCIYTQVCIGCNSLIRDVVNSFVLQPRSHRVLVISEHMMHGLQPDTSKTHILRACAKHVFVVDLVT